MKGVDRHIVGVFLIALVIRLTYLFTVRNEAYYQIPLLDSAWYHRSALAILKQSFRGDGVFFRAPLYSYWVAFWYRLLGENPLGPKVVQLVLGAGTCALLVAALRYVFDRRTALISGMVAGLYPTLIFYDGELLATSVASFLGVLLLFLVFRASEERTTGPWLGAGLVLGAAAITRPQILLVGLGLLAWLALDREYSRRCLITFALGSAVIILPVTTHNAFVGKDAVLIAYQGGVNFYMGNNPDADGKSARLPGWSESSRDWITFEDDTRQMAEAEADRPLSPSQESRFWTIKTLRSLAVEPGRAVGLFGRKVYYLVNGFEIPNNKDIYFFKQYSPVLNVLVWKQWLAFPTGVLFPLAVAGIILSAARRKRYLVLYLFLFCQAAAILLFFVCARFRVAILPVLIPFAVWGTRELIEFSRNGRRRAGISAVTALVLLMVSNSSLLGVTATARWRDYYDLGLVHAEMGEYGRADLAFRQALRLKNDEASIYYNLGLTRMNAGDLESAVRYLRDALQIDPEMHSARNNLGICLGQMGRIEEAKQEFLVIIGADPDHAEARANLRLIEKLQEEKP